MENRTSVTAPSEFDLYLGWIKAFDRALWLRADTEFWRREAEHLLALSIGMSATEPQQIAIRGQCGGGKTCGSGAALLASLATASTGNVVTRTESKG